MILLDPVSHEPLVPEGGQGPVGEGGQRVGGEVRGQAVQAGPRRRGDPRRGGDPGPGVDDGLGGQGEQLGQLPHLDPQHLLLVRVLGGGQPGRPLAVAVRPRLPLALPGHGGRRQWRLSGAQQAPETWTNGHSRGQQVRSCWNSLPMKEGWVVVLQIFYFR